MGGPSAIDLESPLDASQHDISKLPLLGIFSSLMIDMPTVTVKLFPLPLLPGLNYSKNLMVQHITSTAQQLKIILPPVPFMCSQKACTTKSPFYASLLHVITSKLPLSGPFDSSIPNAPPDV
jgi:hypothetical protein